jgi:thiol-disulfide isomerase/thioredoxin
VKPRRRIAANAALSLLLYCAAAGAKVGDAAPDFSRVDFAGNSVRLSAYHGKVVLLNFWASWCGPCLEEMPRLSAWQRAYAAQGLKIVGVSMDDDPEAAKRLLTRRPVAYPVVMGDAALGESFGGVLGLPLSFLIDTHGRLVGRYPGGGDPKTLEARIKALLPGNRPTSATRRPGTTAD